MEVICAHRETEHVEFKGVGMKRCSSEQAGDGSSSDREPLCPWGVTAQQAEGVPEGRLGGLESRGPRADTSRGSHAAVKRREEAAGGTQLERPRYDLVKDVDPDPCSMS